MILDLRSSAVWEAAAKLARVIATQGRYIMFRVNVLVVSLIARLRLEAAVQKNLQQVYRYFA